MFPNVENMIVAPIMKRMEIVMTIEVSFISWMNINYKEIVERKAFLAITKYQCRVS